MSERFVGEMALIRQKSTNNALSFSPSKRANRYLPNLETHVKYSLS